MDSMLFFTPSEVVLSLPTPVADSITLQAALRPRGRLTGADLRTQVDTSPSPPTVVRLQFEDANPNPEVIGAERLPGVVNYFLGNDPTKWRTNLPTYAGIVYKQLYPGIDLRYDGTGGQLKGTYTIVPGADPMRIHWRYDGISDVRVDESTGNLLITAPALAGVGQGAIDKKLLATHTLIEHAPVAWQTFNGKRVPVITRYTVTDDGGIGFAMDRYDRTQPLTIDPTLTYSSYLGGSSSDNGTGIAVDSTGNAYIVGDTSSTDFPTVNPIQPANNGGRDLFIVKVNAAGSALVYSTYLGGTSSDYAEGGIAVDSSGNAYVTGFTASTNFPTVNAVQPTFGGCGLSGLFCDAFVTKLNATGSALVYSTYLGGSDDDYAEGIAVDSSGNAYIAGATYSTNFPTAHALDGTLNGIADAFVTKLNTTGSALAYSTYLGGSNGDYGLGVAVDSSGNAYVSGYTDSTNFPTINAVQPTFGGGFEDGFVTKVNATGSALAYSTYLGGSIGYDYAEAIAVDSSGNAYVTGEIQSTDFPTANAIQPSFGGGNYDAFVTKLNATGSAFVYSTYLGGNDIDDGIGITADGSGNAYLAGRTYSTNFPIANPVQSAESGLEDAFITKVNPTGSALVYSTYLGGTGHDDAAGIAVDSSGNAYVTGFTESTNFPTANALDPTLGGTRDAFVVKIGENNRLLNPSFELDANGDNRPDNWTSNSKFTRSTGTTPHEGTFVGQFRATDNSSVTIKQTVNNLSAGTTYTASCWVNIPTQNDTTFTFKIQVQWKRADNTTISTSTVKSYTATTTGWNQAAKNFVAPAGTAKAIIIIKATSLNGTIYVDDCVFR